MYVVSYRYFIVPSDFMTDPVTTVGVAVLPPAPTSQHRAHDFILSIGEIKVFRPHCDIHVNDYILTFYV